MSFSNPLKFTNTGREVQLQALSGKALVFTTVRMGDGELSSAISVMTSLVNERASVAVNSVATNSKYATIEAIFKNTDFSEGFYWRELGVYVANPSDPDNRDADILYSYQNSGELAEYINSPDTSVIEKIIRIPVFVGDVSNVSVNVAPIVQQDATITQSEESTIEDEDFLTFYDNSEIKNKKISFENIKEKIISKLSQALSTLTLNVNATSTNLAAHIEDKDNPHNVTAKQVGAAAESHTHNSYFNAEAKYYPHTENMSADDLTVPVALIYMSKELNSELCSIFNSSFAYIFTVFYGKPSTTARRTQVAISYNTNPVKIASRSFADEWTPWDPDTYDSDNPLPIDSGGTGATTVEDALVNLGLSNLITSDSISNSKFTLDEDGLDLTPITGAAWFANQVIGSLYLAGRLIDVVLVGANPYGEVDSSAAIQNALERAHDLGGAIVFFPTGTYRLDNCVYYPSNVTLLFAPGATLLRGNASLRYLLANGIENTATGYNGTENVQIMGATFDGNSSFLTTSINDNKCTLLNTVHAKNITVENCTFKNGNVWHLYEVCASENVKIIDCIFDGSNYGGTTSQINTYSELLQLDNDYVSGSTASYGATINGTSGDLTPCKNIYIKGCKFICNGYTNAIGNHNPQSKKHSLIRISDCFFMGGGGTGGYIDFDSSTIEVDIYNNSFDGNAVTITASNSKVTVHDNRIENASTPYTGNLTAYCNLISGELDSASADDVIESIDFNTFGAMRTGDSTYGYATLLSFNIKKYKGRIMGELKFSAVTTNGNNAILPVMVNEGYRPKLTSACWAEVNNSGNSATGVGYLSSASDTLRITFSKSLSSANNVTVFFDYAV